MKRRRVGHLGRLAGPAVVTVALLAGVSACDEPPARFVVQTSPVRAAADDPVRFGPVPAFDLVDQDGNTFGSAELAGKPWGLAAIFTTCSGPCPAVMANLVEVQDQLEGTDALLIALSVDPGYDTPEVMRAYAEEFGADLSRWRFLTGDEAEIFTLLRGGFSMATERAPDGEASLGMHVTHDTRVVAVDRDGEKRGWYHARDPEEIELFVARLRHLAQEGLGVVAASADH